MSAKAVAVVLTVSTLFFLTAVINQSWARPSSTAKERGEEGQLSHMTQNNKEEDRETTDDEPSSDIYREEERQRQRELSRDTFLRLNPNPRGETDEESAHISANGEKNHRQVYELEGSVDRPPLRDGDTLMALTADDTLIETAQMNNCRGDLFKHKVRMAGCRPKTIVNRFCHGSCASFYIPRLRSKKLKATFQSCAACVPTETDLVQVQLDCPGREEGHLNRTVVRVKRCACRNIVLEEEEGKEGEAEEANGPWGTETP